jgi:hypothetical protein
MGTNKYSRAEVIFIWSSGQGAYEYFVELQTSYRAGVIWDRSTHGFMQVGNDLLNPLNEAETGTFLPVSMSHKSIANHRGKIL